MNELVSVLINGMFVFTLQDRFLLDKFSNCDGNLDDRYW